jgi:DNA processing protein
MANLKYWLWLTGRKNLTGQKLNLVLERFGSPEGAYFADPEEYELVEGLSQSSRRSLADKSLAAADRILGDCDKLGIHIMTMQDANYPERLRAIHQPPAVLYWKGREVAFDEEAAIAIVGTREATPYGQHMADELSMDLSRAGALIVSGIAQGIDAAAVRGALKAGGPVVSVLGGGLDVIYPRLHKDLYEDVAAAGTLISEYPPGTEPRGDHFPVRNRIISGLSVGVIVVESPKFGGGLLTANHALEQDRELFAVPGPADGVNSEGTNRLIQEGCAKLILNAGDVICEFVDRFPDRFGRARPMSDETREQRLSVFPEKRDTAKRKTAAPAETAEKEVDNPGQMAYIDWKDYKNKMTDDQRDVLLALEQGPMVADDLVERAQLPARRVLAALTILQIQGMAVEESGKRFRAAVRLKME